MERGRLRVALDANVLIAGIRLPRVTSDRDFTDPGATAERFRERVRVMLPAVFLREVLGWPSEALEAMRNRAWEDLASNQGVDQ